MDLMACREILGLSRAAAVQATGLPRTTYLHAENKTREISASILKKIIESFHGIALTQLPKIKDISAKTALIEFLANPLNVPARIKLQHDVNELASENGGDNDLTEGLGQSNKAGPYKPGSISTRDRRDGGAPRNSLRKDRTWRRQSNLLHHVEDSGITSKGECSVVSTQTTSDSHAEKYGRSQLSRFAELELSHPQLSALRIHAGNSATLAQFIISENATLSKATALLFYLGEINPRETAWEPLVNLYRRVTQPGTKQFIRRIIAEICCALPMLPRESTSLQYVLGRLNPSRNGQRERTRSRDEVRVQAKKELFAYIEAEYAVLSNQIVKKTMDSARTHGDRLNYLRDFITDANHAEMLSKAYGRIPVLATLYKDASSFLSKPDRYADVAKYFRSHIGHNPPYAGFALEIDGTGAEEFIRVKKSFKLSKAAKRILINAVDGASGRMWCWNTVTESESSDYDAAGIFMLKQWGFCPRWLLGDRVGGVFEALRYLKPGQPDKVKAFLLALISGGCVLYTHTPNNSQGKAHVENAHLQLQRRLTRAVFRRARKLRLNEEFNQKCVEFESEAQVQQFIDEAVSELNNSHIRGSESTRDELFNLTSAVDSRTPFALAPNWETEILNDVVSNSWVSRISGNSIRVKISGEVVDAELSAFREVGATEPSKEFPSFKEPPVVLSVPKGMLATDANKRDEFQCVIIEPRKGQPRLIFCEALKIARDEYNRLTNKPSTGTFIRLPDPPERQHAARIRQLREEDERRINEKQRKMAAAFDNKSAGGAECDPLQPRPVDPNHIPFEPEITDDKELPLPDWCRPADGTFGA